MSRYPNRDRALRQLDRHHAAYSPGGIVMPLIPIDLTALNESLARQSEAALASVGVVAQTLQPILDGLRKVARGIDQGLYV